MYVRTRCLRTSHHSFEFVEAPIFPFFFMMLIPTIAGAALMAVAAVVGAVDRTVYMDASQSVDTRTAALVERAD